MLLSFDGRLVWWGEATDEPAREDSRPTDIFKLRHHLPRRCCVISAPIYVAIFTL